jgi:hypothetical protein
MPSTALIRRLTTAATIGCLATAAIAQAAAAPSGTYSTTIKGTTVDDGYLNATWSLTFKPAGQYAVARDGHVFATGRDTIHDNKITFTQGSQCKSPGVYKFKLTASKLTFTSVSDKAACAAGRKAVLAYPFTKS